MENLQYLLAAGHSFSSSDFRGLSVAPYFATAELVPCGLLQTHDGPALDYQ
jgi:hypothetical protein